MYIEFETLKYGEPILSKDQQNPGQRNQNPKPSTPRSGSANPGQNSDQMNRGGRQPEQQRQDPGSKATQQGDRNQNKPGAGH